MMIRSILLLVAMATSSSVTAFVVTPLQSSSLSLARRSMSSAAEEETALSPFDSYAINDSSQRLVSKDVVVGTGESPKEGDILTMGYTVRVLSTGKEVDSGEAFKFKLGAGNVLPGWEKGVPGMQVGGKRVLRIPPTLAYGARGCKDELGNQVIPANADLEFDIELKDVTDGNILTETMMKYGFGKNKKTAIVVVYLCVWAALPQIMAFGGNVLSSLTGSS